jgi:hypothetical protein
MLKSQFLASLLHKKSNFSSFSNLATLFGHLATLKRVATPCMRTADLWYVFFPISLIGAYERARILDMLKRDTKWTLVFEDFKSGTFDVTKLNENTNFLQLNDRSCCAIKNLMNGKPVNKNSRIRL